MDSNLEFLLLSPFRAEQNKQRFSKIMGLKDHILLTAKAFDAYITSGKKLCDSLNDIVSTFQLCGEFSSDPTISSICNCVNYFQSTLMDHYHDVKSSIISPLINFVDVDIKKCDDLSRDYQQKNSNYFQCLDKAMAKTQDPSLLKHAKGMKMGVSLSMYKAERSIELVERKYAYELTSILLMFLKSVAVTYRQCLFEFDSSKEEYASLQLAIPLFMDEIKTYDQLTELNKRTIIGLQDMEIDSSLDKENYLWMKTEGFGKQYKRVYATIKKNKFSYYRDLSKGEGVSVDLITSTVKSVSDSNRPNCFKLINPNDSIIFQAESENEMQKWMEVIQNNILYSFDHQEDVKEDVLTHEVDVCADCGAENPTWCCLNWGTKICINCSGIHRSFGTNFSIVRSLTLDYLDRFNKDLLDKIGNSKANSLLLARRSEFGDEIPEGKWPNDVDRNELISNKYKSLKYAVKLDKEDDIFEYIKKGDFDGVLKCVLSGALRDFPNGKFSPLHAAAAYGDMNITLLIAYNSDNMNSLDEGGWSAMSYAAYYKRAEICSMLMKIGCNPLASDTGFPYHIAVQNRDLRIGAIFVPYWKGDQTLPLYVPPVEVFPEEINE